MQAKALVPMMTPILSRMNADILALYWVCSNDWVFLIYLESILEGKRYEMTEGHVLDRRIL
jgi:hypothetical protein